MRSSKRLIIIYNTFINLQRPGAGACSGNGYSALCACQMHFVSFGFSYVFLRFPAELCADFVYLGLRLVNNAYGVEIIFPFCRINAGFSSNFGRTFELPIA